MAGRRARGGVLSPCGGAAVCSVMLSLLSLTAFALQGALYTVTGGERWCIGWGRGSVIELDGPRPYLDFFAVQSGDAWLPPHLRQTCLNRQSLKVHPFSADRAVSRLCALQTSPAWAAD